MTNYVEHMTWQEFLDKSAEMGGAYAKSQGPDKWAGGSYAAAVKMVNNGGYLSALPLVENFVRKVETDFGKASSPAFDFSYQVAGQEVDMGRYVAGDPECMMLPVPIHVMKTGRIIKLVVPITTSASTDKEEILKRGASVMALVDILWRLQHPAEIWASYSCHGYGGTNRASYNVKVQGANDSKDKGRVMFALAHPMMLRRLFFAYADTRPDEEVRAFGFKGTGGYGGPSYSSVKEDMDGYANNVIIVPDLMTYGSERVDWLDDAACVRWISEQVEIMKAG